MGYAGEITVDTIFEPVKIVLIEEAFTWLSVSQNIGSWEETYISPMKAK